MTDHAETHIGAWLTSTSRRVRALLKDHIWPALRDLSWIIRETADQFSLDQAWQRSAALAFYMILSLVPTLIIVLRVVGMIYQVEVAESEITHEISRILGSESAGTIARLMQGADDPLLPSHNLLNTLIGITTLFVGSTSLFSNLKAALNTLWGIDPKEVRGLLNLIRTRLLAFFFVTAIGFLLVILLLADASLILAGRYLGDVLPPSLEGLIRHVLDISTLRTLVRLVVIAALIALVFKVLPDARIAWPDACIGGIVTALLITLGQWLFGIYLHRSNVGSAFGAAGSLVVLLVWVYYTALAFFYGVEFTYVYANHYGATIQVDPSQGLLGRARVRIRSVVRRSRAPHE